ncbi:hypothetical protein K8I31_10365 [bacterium]|nr:hypothetical protein [bacterium]
MNIGKWILGLLLVVAPLGVSAEIMRASHLDARDFSGAWNGGAQSQTAPFWKFAIDDPASSAPKILRANLNTPNPTSVEWGSAPQADQYSNLAFAHNRVIAAVEKQGEWRFVSAPANGDSPQWTDMGPAPVETVENISVNEQDELVVSGQGANGKDVWRGAFSGGGSGLSWRQQDAALAGSRSGNALMGEFDLGDGERMLSLSWNQKRNGIQLQYRTSPAAGEPYSAWSQPVQSDATQLNKSGRFLQYRLTRPDGSLIKRNELPPIELTYKSGSNDSKTDKQRYSNSSGGGSGLNVDSSPDLNGVGSMDIDSDADLDENNTASPSSTSSNGGASSPSKSNPPSPSAKSSKPQQKPNTNQGAQVSSQKAQANPAGKSQQNKNSENNQSKSPSESSANANNKSAQAADDQSNQPPKDQSASPDKNKENENKSPSEKANDDENKAPSDDEQPSGDGGAQSPSQSNGNGSGAGAGAASNGNGNSGHGAPSLNNNNANNAGNGAGQAQDNASPSPSPSNESPEENGENSPTDGDDAPEQKNINPLPTGIPLPSPASIPMSSELASSKPLPKKANPKPGDDAQGGGDESAPGNGDTPGANVGGKAPRESGDANGGGAEGDKSAGSPMGGLRQDERMNKRYGDIRPGFGGSGGGGGGSASLGGRTKRATDEIEYASAPAFANLHSSYDGKEETDDSGWWWLLLVAALASWLGYRIHQERKHRREMDELQAQQAPRVAPKKLIDEARSREGAWEQITMFVPEVKAVAVKDGIRYAVMNSGDVWKEPVSSNPAQSAPLKHVARFDGEWKQAHLCVSENALFFVGEDVDGTLSGEIAALRQIKAKPKTLALPKGLQSIERVWYHKSRLWIQGDVNGEPAVFSAMADAAGAGGWVQETPNKFDAGDSVCVSSGAAMFFAGSPKQDRDHLWLYTGQNRSRGRIDWKPAAKTAYRGGDVFLFGDAKKCFMVECDSTTPHIMFHVFGRGEEGEFLGRFTRELDMPTSAQVFESQVSNGRLLLAGRDPQTDRVVHLQAKVKTILGVNQN